MSSFEGIPSPQFDQIVDAGRCRELLKSFQAFTGWQIRLAAPSGRTHVASDDSAAFRETTAFLAWLVRSSESNETRRGDEGGTDERGDESDDVYSLIAYQGGLYEVACPLVVHGESVATAICGPVFFEAPDESLLCRLAEENGIETDAPAAVIRSTPVRPRADVERVAHFCGTLLEPFLAAQSDCLRNRQFERRWESLFENMNTGFARLGIVRDEAGVPRNYRILAVNSAFERLTGMAREEMLGKTLLEVVPDAKKTWMNRFRRIAEHGEHEMFVDYSPAFARFYAVDAFVPHRTR